MNEKIQIQELIKILIENRKFIIIVTIICTLFSGIISFFIIPEKYKSNAVIQVSNTIQEQNTGFIQSYIGKVLTPQVFTEQLKNESNINKTFQNKNLDNDFILRNLRIESINNSDIINLSYSSDTPDNAQKELETIINAAINDMNRTIRKNLIKLETSYSLKLNTLTKDIEGLVNEYNKLIRDNNLPEILILQTIINSDLTLNVSLEQLQTLANINGELQDKLLQLGAQIQSKSSEYQKLFNEYQSIKSGLDHFEAEHFIHLIVDPTFPRKPASPNLILNIAVGLIFGLFLGIGTAVFRYLLREPVN